MCKITLSNSELISSKQKCPNHVCLQILKKYRDIRITIRPYLLITLSLLKESSLLPLVISLLFVLIHRKNSEQEIVVLILCYKPTCPCGQLFCCSAAFTIYSFILLIPSAFPHENIKCLIRYQSIESAHLSRHVFSNDRYYKLYTISKIFTLLLNLY